MSISSPIVDASFSENFYGLKRRRRPYIETDRASAAVAGLPGGQALRKQDIWRSLLLLVRKHFPLHHLIQTNLQIGIPYLRAKAQDYFEQLGGGSDSDFDEGLDPRQIQALTDKV